MMIGVFLCTCGTAIAERIDVERLAAAVGRLPDVAWCRTVGFLCSEAEKERMEGVLRDEAPDRVVVAACSPREHEATFMGVMEKAGLNPYLLQMVNIREQVAWITPEISRATRKAESLLAGAVARVRRHAPLETKRVEAVPDVLVVGGGPAGIKAAIELAEAGRRVVLVERSAVIGGLPVRFEEVAPGMECGPCMLEPLLGELLHGRLAERIEILTMAEVTGAVGYCGNFTVTIGVRGRGVDRACIGCGECAAACPATAANPYDYGLGTRKAIDFPFPGALPNLPYLDAATCRRAAGEECRACKDACHLGEETVRFDEPVTTVERSVGAVVIATGGEPIDAVRFPALRYGEIPGVYTSVEFERLLSSSGPTGGKLATAGGREPESVAIVHCVGSRDPAHRDYCSGVCCAYALKFGHIVASRFPGASMHHVYRELNLPGKGGAALLRRGGEKSFFHRYRMPDGISLSPGAGGRITVTSDTGQDGITADIVVLCPAIVPAEGTAGLAKIFDTPLDHLGFFEELHGTTDTARGKVKGIYLAGSCREPGDIRQAMLGGSAAAAAIHADIPEGKELEISPVCAVTDRERCAGCGICVSLCPYRAAALVPDGKAEVNQLLCHGCGSCAAGCPGGAISVGYFTREAILAELEGILR